MRSLIPLKFTWISNLIIILDNISMLNIKIKGEIWSPCLGPFCALKKPLGEPFVRIEKVVVGTHSFIRLVHPLLYSKISSPLIGNLTLQNRKLFPYQPL